MDLTIIITTINEAENLKILIPSLKETLAPVCSAFEILIIDGNSTDGTAELATHLGCRVEQQSGPGYAQAIRDGIYHAIGQYTIVMDADGSHHPHDARRLYEQRNAADIVINSRYVQGGGSNTEAWRQLLSQILNVLYRVVLGLPFKEVSGGFRIYRTEILKSLTLDSQFYEIQEELLIKPYWLGHKIIEIPYQYRDREHGVSKAKVITYGFHLLQALAKMRMKKKTFLSQMKEKQ